MIGHEGVVRAMLRLIRDKLPEALTELETELGLTPGTIPRVHPKSVHGSWVDVVHLGQFPSVMVIQDDSETRNTGRQIGIGATWDEYEWTYPLRLILHNFGADYGETELQRKRLMMGLRLVLLRHRGLIVDREEEEASVQPESLREKFAGGATDESKKLLLESIIQLDVKTLEIIMAAQGDLGPSETHPALGLL